MVFLQIFLCDRNLFCSRHDSVISLSFWKALGGTRTSLRLLHLFSPFLFSSAFVSLPCVGLLSQLDAVHGVGWNLLLFVIRAFLLIVLHLCSLRDLLPRAGRRGENWSVSAVLPRVTSRRSRGSLLDDRSAQFMWNFNIKIPPLLLGVLQVDRLLANLHSKEQVFYSGAMIPSTLRTLHEHKGLFRSRGTISMYVFFTQ